ncbi:response regulator [Melioribacteraceae bacterium 4301-Me]|uniref:glycine cleavage system protein H n=1 Tax=Pyranulibacter aquaticus TaxID=3163344 RepID=UPI0035956723
MAKEYDILIIDDEQVIIDSVIKIASMEGFTAIGELNALTALNRLQKEKFKLIICDIMMPEMDGFKFIAETERLKIDIPIIITTGYTTVENAVESLYQGAIGFIPKPFTTDELISIIHRGLNYWKLLKSKQAKNIEFVYVPCPAKYYRLGYSTWLNKENDETVLIGATDLYTKTINTIKKINLMNVNDNAVQGQACAWFETEENLTHHLLSPLSGKIISINEKLITNPQLIEKDPYFEGWIYRFIPTEYEYEIKKLIPCSSDRS